MEDYEKLGTFYLGKLYDLKSKTSDGLLLYDSKDLLTHGVCLGMTGSGKTGLCIGLLEEAAIDGVPSILIDPKGDLVDIMLTFPDLRPEDFRPWINEDEAARKGLSPDDFAKQQAEMWTKGLADWGEDGARIGRLKAQADFAIYTPGSTAGLPVSILKSFGAPNAAIRGDDEALGDRINTAVTSLLGMVGIAADPIKSREHILLSTLFNSLWSSGKDIDLATLIEQVQNPPFAKIGVLDMESFYPSKERFQLATALNNLIAAPTFQTWLKGQPLDIQSFLYTSQGKPRVSIFSIAHLGDQERMFFVSLLLNEILGWVRTQPGTSSLRALLYMDEIFGFFPPVANPPSKPPLLALLKQARAFGLGVLLATQNPVDLDYKGLANAGTWFIGRLQTEQDKDRLLGGLQGVASETRGGFDRKQMEDIIAGLGNRVFMMYNVHEDAPVVFQSRWTMSYLAGPLTRAQIKTLMDPYRPAVEPDETVAAAPPVAAPAAAPPLAVAVTLGVGAAAAASPAATAPSAERPAPASGVGEMFLPLRGALVSNAALVYQPGVLGIAQVSFVSSDTAATSTVRIERLAPAPAEGMAVDWDGAVTLDLVAEDFDKSPQAGAVFAGLPPSMGRATTFRGWETDFSGWIFRTQSLELLRSDQFKMQSNPGESEGDFRVRLQQVAREKRDAESEALRQKYATKVAGLQQQALRAQLAVDREAEQAKGRGVQTAISLGATILGAFAGRKLGTSTLGRATTTMRDVSRSIDQAGDIKRAKETLAAIQQRQADLDAEFKSELDSMTGQMDAGTEVFTKVLVRPRKSDIGVQFLGLAWTPNWHGPDGSVQPAWQ